MEKMTDQAFEDLTKAVRVEDLYGESCVVSLILAMKKVFGPTDESVYELGSSAPDSYVEDPEAIPPDSDDANFWGRIPVTAQEEEATARQPRRRTPAEAEFEAVRSRQAEVLEEARRRQHAEVLEELHEVEDLDLRRNQQRFRDLIKVA